MSWRARGCPVSALGLVGGALAGRHRASPILQQDTSFEAELPVDRCVRGERASVCKTTSNHPASQTWRPCLLGHLRCIAAYQIALLELYTLPEAVTERWFATLTVLRRFSAKLGTACSLSWSAARGPSGLWKSPRALPPTPARARPRQCAAGSSEAPPRAPARREGRNQSRHTRDAHRDAPTQARSGTAADASAKQRWSRAKAKPPTS